jgi:citrate lyase subunit beta / citryl-CoA lyase
MSNLKAQKTIWDGGSYSATMRPMEVFMRTDFRRSFLYVPGDSERMLQKAVGVDADVLLLNLEDGVSSSKKDTARKNVAQALKNMDFGGHEIVVRINSLNSSLGQSDLAEIIPCCPDGLCLPKVEQVSDITDAESAVLELEIRHGVGKGSILLHAMIESAAGLLRSLDIATASPRVTSLIFGSADYANDLRCQPGEDRSELSFALQMLVTSSRAAGIDAIDAPCFDLRNDVLLQSESRQARRLGFGGKSALHPDQLEIINRVFDVTADEIAWAERVLAELDDAENRGKALTTFEGKLLDNPHRAAAERILRRKRAS